MEKKLCKADIRPTPAKIIVTIWYFVGAVLFIIGTFGMNAKHLEVDIGVTNIDYYLFFYPIGYTVAHKSKGTVDTSFYAGNLILGLLITFAVFGLPIIIKKVTNYLARNCSLSLDEKSINGNRKKLFSNAQLNLPIDKVDSIMISENIFDKLSGGKTILIRSASGLIKFPWVQNADEFLSATLAKIEEFKQDVKNENQKIVSAVAQNAVGVNNSSAAEKIKELKSLLDDGLINQEEFDAKRKDLIEKM